MAQDQSLSAERLRELLSYDQESGCFTWASHRRKVKPGTPAGHTRRDGYVCIRIDYASYFAHRLAWLYTHGEWPSLDVDHIDGNPSNNRIDNLRSASRKTNNENRRRVRSDSRSGVLGVRLRGNGRFEARIQVGGCENYLGSFPSADAASAAYVTAKRRLHVGCTL